MTDDAGHFSRARISRAPASARLQVVRRNASRIDDWFCRSRQILQAPSANVFARFLSDPRQPTAFSKVGIDLFIPCTTLSVPDERG
jgi:hypothetical protein